MKAYSFGSVAGLKLTVRPAAFVGSVLVWVILSVVGRFVLKMSLGMALLGGVLCLLLHWVSGLLHHLGHAFTAQRVGYPMAGIRFGSVWGLLGTSLYPAQEPVLPASIHLRRALGGPVASGLVTVISGGLVLVLSGFLHWVAVFLLLDNLLIYTLQVFLPLGFNDGSTILQVMRGNTPH